MSRSLRLYLLNTQEQDQSSGYVKTRQEKGKKEKRARVGNRHGMNGAEEEHEPELAQLNALITV